MVSGIPFAMGLRARIKDPCVYVIFGAPKIVRLENGHKSEPSCALAVPDSHLFLPILLA